MVLVVLWHTAQSFSRQTGDETGIWLVTSHALEPLRMPLFFAISGMLAAGALERPLSKVRAKYLGLLYLSALWTLLFAARLAIPATRDGYPAPPIGQLALAIAAPTSFWYLWALAVYFLIAWCARRLLGRYHCYMLLPLACLAAAAPVIGTSAAGLLDSPLDGVMGVQVAANLLWFYAGTISRTTWEGAMARATTVRCVASTIVFAAATASATAAGVAAETKVLLAPLALVAATQLLGTARLTARPARALQWVGRHTLPVYILHPFAGSLVTAAFMFTGAREGFLAAPLLWGAIVPLAVTPLIVIGTRVAGGVVAASPAWWLLAAPAWLVGQRTTQLRAQWGAWGVPARQWRSPTATRAEVWGWSATGVGEEERLDGDATCATQRLRPERYPVEPLAPGDLPVRHQEAEVVPIREGAPEIGVPRPVRHEVGHRPIGDAHIPHQAAAISERAHPDGR